MRDLTGRQRLVMDYIISEANRQGFPPTIREIARHFGMRSPGSVRDHLRALERKGHLRRRTHASRALEILMGRGGTMPLLGRIAAGKPIEAVATPEEVDIPGLFPYKNCFLLEVKGDSMIGDFIQNGDYVIVQKRSTAEDGEMVVALVNGTDATLKRFYRQKDRIRLEPANPAMPPIYTRDVQIQGVVLGVLRKYK